MPPDDLPIPSTADDISGVKPETLNKQHPARKIGPESEVRGGPEVSDDPPLDESRRDKRR
ncbi:hypothetical protein [Acidisoma silvae]|uniref:Uncharacterized protein n=1 Tax=Acidisoma silvae TaxID=2802396 RepID=A0A963YNL6_9PROT|nr:hypothetical protein [Acidisoma silvae]MCB8874166.1 hypothetical protein [Acidisoma silvae]